MDSLLELCRNDGHEGARVDGVDAEAGKRGRRGLAAHSEVKQGGEDDDDEPILIYLKAYLKMTHPLLFMGSKTLLPTAFHPCL